MSLYPCPGTAMVTSHLAAVCAIHDPSKTFPTAARVVFGSVSNECQIQPVVLFFFGRGGGAEGTGPWADDVPRLQLTLDPTSVRELRVDTDGVMHVDALVGAVSDTEFSPLAIRLAEGVAANPTPEQWLEASKATALDFMSYWNEEAADAAAAESAKLRNLSSPTKKAAAAAAATAAPAPALGTTEASGDATEGGADAPAVEAGATPKSLTDSGAAGDAEEEDDEDEEEGGDGVDSLAPGSDLLGADGMLTKRDTASSSASVAGTSTSAGLRSTSSRMLKMKEVRRKGGGVATGMQSGVCVHPPSPSQLLLVSKSFILCCCSPVPPPHIATPAHRSKRLRWACPASCPT